MIEKIKYEVDELLTPEQVFLEIKSNGVCPDSAITIVEEIYQPLASIIKDLDRRLKELEK